MNKQTKSRNKPINENRWFPVRGKGTGRMSGGKEVPASRDGTGTSLG